MEHAKTHLGHDFYVEENVPVSLLQANFVMESHAYEEELKTLTTKNSKIMEKLTNKIYEANELQMQLDVKQEELKQMTIEISKSNLRMEKYRKKGIPYSNRSFDCLHVRLKNATILMYYFSTTLRSLSRT